MNWLRWIDLRKHGWQIFFVIYAASFAFVGYSAYKIYEYVPFLVDFVEEDGKTVVFPDKAIANGYQIFERYVLLDHGNSGFLSGGGMRGPDFYAEALHLTAMGMNEYYLNTPQGKKELKDKGIDLAEMPGSLAKQTVENLFRAELKTNRYNSPHAGKVTLTASQVYAFHKMFDYFKDMFGEPKGRAAKELYTSEPQFITNEQELKDLTAFFYWCGWLNVAARPDSYYFGDYYWPIERLARKYPNPLYSSRNVDWNLIPRVLKINEITSWPKNCPIIKGS